MEGILFPRGVVEGREGLEEYRSRLGYGALEKALGPEHPDVAQILENYADLLRKTNQKDEAAKLEARAKEIRAKHALQNLTK